MNHNSFAALALSALCTLAVPTTGQVQALPITVDLDFKGGRLSDLIAALRATGEQVNIVAPELAANVPVPAMQLRGVTVEAALRATAMVVEAPYDIAVQPIGQPPGGTVLALRVQERPRNAMVAGTPGGSGMANDVVVFSLRLVTKAMPGEPESVTLKTETVLTAIDTGLAIVDPKGRPTIKFHEDSGLLFVSGSPQHIEIVSSVLRQLENSVQQARQAAMQKPRPATDPAPAEGEDKGKKTVR